MKTIRRIMQRAITPSLTALLATLFLLGLGCESDRRTDDVEGFMETNPYRSQPRDVSPDEELSITPTTAEGNQIGQQLLFTASGGRQPYDWHVANPGRGTLAIRTTTEAIYIVNQVGHNDVIVTDRRGHAAIARIDGEPAPLTAINADPDTLDNDGDVAVLSVEGGVAPFTWQVEFPSRGNLLSSSGTSVSYVRNSAGDNVVTVTDGVGASLNVLISQP